MNYKDFFIDDYSNAIDKLNNTSFLGSKFSAKLSDVINFFEGYATYHVDENNNIDAFEAAVIDKEESRLGHIYCINNDLKLDDICEFYINGNLYDDTEYIKNIIENNI